MRSFSKYDCNNIVLTTCNCVENSKGTFGQPTVVLNTIEGLLLQSIIEIKPEVILELVAGLIISPT